MVLFFTKDIWWASDFVLGRFPWDGLVNIFFITPPPFFSNWRLDNSGYQKHPKVEWKMGFLMSLFWSLCIPFHHTTSNMSKFFLFEFHRCKKKVCLTPNTCFSNKKKYFDLMWIGIEALTAEYGQHLFLIQNCWLKYFWFIKQSDMKARSFNSFVFFIETAAGQATINFISHEKRLPDKMYLTKGMFTTPVKKNLFLFFVG